ncbi:segregation and condensation protein B [Clostridium acetireducens DSM 10703]|jgi:segregation and condensation protein B|uniref:Segregation and condensation protein B n=1 Tax=Clostridium acetireducens DSM 10703 TaxID=1121290 RepID=A0A1E8F1V8_9CLOT|nr:SMC-Scp complex subunit ScpB [Clostridium acetireducens]OFI07618.1 segregation and condensation protein B [Clostridium acetireducens DSM 10703]
MKSINMKQIEIEETSLKEMYFSIIESLLFVTGESLSLKDIASIIELEVNSTEEIIKEMAKKYNEESRGIKLVKTNNKYQLVTKPKNSKYIEKLLKTNTRQSLSQASLETLAIIVYRQPITRVEIDDIRGVKSEKALNNLLEKELIEECGRKNVIGRPILYRTTNEFLKYFGLESIESLPSLDSFLQEKSE